MNRFYGKTVLIRVDFNVPLDKSGNVKDDTKIKSSLKTIKFYLSKSAKVVLLTHLGEPDGKVVPKLRLDKVSKVLSRLLKRKVIKFDDSLNADLSFLKNRDVALLENLRFYKEETLCDKTFSKKLASKGDFYVNDAFSVCHREHASVVGVPHYLDSAMGFNLKHEVNMLSKILSLKGTIVMGGAKVSTKIKLVKNLLSRSEYILIGGGMCFTFLKAKGVDIGKSIYEKSMVKECKKLLRNKKIILPVDFVTDKGVRDSCALAGSTGLDIGPKTVLLFKKYLEKSKIVFWNGPLGLFENKKYEKGTREIAASVSKVQESYAGGGETIEAIRKYGLEKRFTHISTGGGASLAFLEKGTLPGIAALKRQV